ncbi:MAG: hypothetical protein LBT43_12360 [Prevotella sp.]|jgi:hypothetical protein|nr:hypothetical protein [Prevotella sp.]
MSQYSLVSIIEQYALELRDKIEYVFYAKALSILVKERLRLENTICNATFETEKDIYEGLLIEVNILISRYWNLQFNLLKGRANYDIVDALGALIVLDIKQAKNVLYHASIYSNNQRQISFQTLLDDIMIIHNKNVFIPCLKKRSKNGIFEIILIDKEIIEKDLCDTHFKGHNYTPKYILKHGTITNYYIIGKRLLRFFKHYDWSINKQDLEIFYIALTQISKERTSPIEIDLVKDKINNIFLANKNANRMLCVLIDLSRTYIHSMVDLRNALSDYFVQGAGLSSSTIRDCLSTDVLIKENEDKFTANVKSICKI